MREITDHIVEGDSANHQVKIYVMDEPGAGGANHVYGIRHIVGKPMDFSQALDKHASVTETLHRVEFQNGPIKEVGINGITNEALIAIVIDRLRSFQAGPYSGRENAVALTHLEDALMWLQRRTRARIARGVEGTHKA